MPNSAEARLNINLLLQLMITMDIFPPYKNATNQPPSPITQATKSGHDSSPSATSAVSKSPTIGQSRLEREEKAEILSFMSNVNLLDSSNIPHNDDAKLRYLRFDGKGRVRNNHTNGTRISYTMPCFIIHI